MFNFWEIIFLFFAFQAIILSLFFFLKRKGDSTANKLLGFYLLLFSANIIYNVLYWSNILFTPKAINLYGILAIIWISYPAIIYLYVRRVVTLKKFSVKDLVHLLPPLTILSFYLPFFLLSKQDKLGVLHRGELGEYVVNLIFNFPITLVVMIGYALFTYISFKKSIIGRNKSRWIGWFLGSFCCYVIAMVTYYFLSRFGIITKEQDYFITYTLIFFIGLVSYFGLVQPDVFDGLSMDKVLPFKKYKNTGLTPDHSKEVKEILLSYMREEKPYLNGNLRLDDLANKLNLSRHHTSQVINEHFDTSFFDFINGYRIEEAKSLLLNASSFNISDVIYASGFNNRVSFYNTFRKHTGLTPTQFRAKLKA